MSESRRHPAALPGRLARRASMLALALGGLWSGPAGAQDAGRIVGRAGQVYRNLTSLQAQFTQTISDRMIGDFDSRGTLIQAGNNHLAMLFSDPEGDRITLDGTHAWIYTPSSAPGQVIRVAIPSDPVYGLNVVAWILDRPTERYRSSFLRVDSVGGRRADVVTMTPLAASLPFTAVTAWLDQADGLPRRIEIQETSGAKRTLILSGIRINAPVPAATFRFTPPSGVRIINQ